MALPGGVLHPPTQSRQHFTDARSGMQPHGGIPTPPAFPSPPPARIPVPICGTGEGAVRWLETERSELCPFCTVLTTSCDNPTAAAPLPAPLLPHWHWGGPPTLPDACAHLRSRYFCLMPGRGRGWGGDFSVPWGGGRDAGTVLWVQLLLPPTAGSKHNAAVALRVSAAGSAPRPPPTSGAVLMCNLQIDKTNHQ